MITRDGHDKTTTGLQVSDLELASAFSASGSWTSHRVAMAASTACSSS